MEFRIADTFTDSLARLTTEEQKVVKTTAFDLQMNPASPGMQFHKLDKSKDKNFWSVRVSSDIRLIVHKTQNSLMLCYVNHHDKAYDWAERRKLETHPTTGAAQLVEIRETVKEVVVPVYVQANLAIGWRSVSAAALALLSLGVLSAYTQATTTSTISVLSVAAGVASGLLTWVPTLWRPRPPVHTLDDLEAEADVRLVLLNAGDLTQTSPRPMPDHTSDPPREKSRFAFRRRVA